jgi:peptidoglycan/LPS O-acetylase OafA/YrhL
MSNLPKQRLDGIEICRGLAATAVVLFHVARHLNKQYADSGFLYAFQFGHSGVDIFFVISGFIILYVHYDDIDRPARVAHYVERRLTRIFPIYWVALFAAILLMLGGGHHVPLYDIVWSAFLLPSHQEPLLGVAWTLLHEMLFYTLFCALLLNRRVGILIFALWLAWILMVAVRPSFGLGLPSTLWGPFNLEFFVGMATALAFKRRLIPAPRTLLAVGVFLFALAAVAENSGMIDGMARIGRLIYGLPSALIVLGAAEFGRTSGAQYQFPRIMQVLGRSSYSIYLFHFIFIGPTWKLWQLLPVEGVLFHIPTFLVLAASGVGGGIFMSRIVEYPLMRFVRRRLNRDRHLASATAAG